MYKLRLSDESFYIVDPYYELTLFKFIFKKRITIKDYLATNKYKNYYLKDLIDNQKIKRTFEILTPTEDERKLPLGVRIKYTEDIREGDLVLGADHKPQKVVELHTGEEQMFDITVNGETYTVNEGHVLELVNKETGEHLQIQVGVYMHMDDDFKSRYVMEITDI